MPSSLGCLAFALMLSVGAGRAAAQAMLADDIVILSKGQREQEKARTTTTHLGGIPGVGGKPVPRQSRQRRTPAWRAARRCGYFPFDAAT